MKKGEEVAPSPLKHHQIGPQHREVVTAPEQERWDQRLGCAGLVHDENEHRKAANQKQPKISREPQPASGPSLMPNSRKLMLLASTIAPRSRSCLRPWPCPRHDQQG